MAQYFLDASDHATNTPLNTLGFDEVGSSFIWSKVLAQAASSTGFWFQFGNNVSYNDLFTDSAGATDQEVLLIGAVNLADVATGLANIGIRLRETIEIACTGVAWSNQGLDSVSTNVAPTFDNTDYYAMRAQVVGTTYRARFWQANDLAGLQSSEPGTWGYVGTAASPASGKAGISWDGGRATHIGIGTNGDSAPFEPVPEPFIAVPVVSGADQIQATQARLNWAAG